LAKQSVLWAFWKKSWNGRFLDLWKKFKLKNGGYLNKSDNHILFLHLNLTSFQLA
jgi:hypothetical protein